MSEKFFIANEILFIFHSPFKNMLTDQESHDSLIEGCEFAIENKKLYHSVYVDVTCLKSGPKTKTLILNSRLIKEANSIADKIAYIHYREFVEALKEILDGLDISSNIKFFSTNNKIDAIEWLKKSSTL